MIRLTYRGRHRNPRPLTVNPERIEDLFMADFARHMRDGMGVDEAMLRAGIDADDALTAWRASS